MIWMGMVAGSLTSVAALPQVVKTVRTGRTNDLSLWQPVLLTVGVGLWMAYGINIGDIPLITMNILPLGANLLLVGMKLRESPV
jgi:MtN3 and saliva related transmembrane protein